MKQKMLNFAVVIEQGENGYYIAKVPDIAGCYTQGKTIPQVLERIKEAIEVCLESENDIVPMKFVSVHHVEIPTA